MEMKLRHKETRTDTPFNRWEVCPLGDIVTKVGSGLTPTGGERVYRKDGRPFLRSQNVGWGHLLLDDIVFIDEETHSSFLDTEIKLDDVLLNITGASIGRSAVANDRLQGGNVNQHVCIIRTDTRRLNPYYLNYFLLSERGQKQIESFQAGGNRQGLNFGQIRSFQILLPTPAEQHAIATALSDIDALITSLDKLIAKKRDIKQATMQQLLTGKTRLEGFRKEIKTAYKQTEVGMIPEDWDVKELGEIGECLIGLTYRPSDVKSDGLLVLRASNIVDSGLIFTDNVFVNVKVSDKLIVCKDDILICVRNGSRNLIGKCALIDNRAKGMTFGAFMSIFRTKYAHFIFYQFQSELIKRQIYENIGATINQITNKNLNSFQIPFPSLPEQQAIVAILSDMDAEIAALEQKRDKTRALKQGMMQELLTGKTRLL